MKEQNKTLAELMATMGCHDVDTGWSGTQSGQKLFFNNITEDQINIDDIAKSLSKLCRYNGQCDEFYSVAEHSVYVSWFCDEEDARWGLIHDATEAYFGDMIRPLKNLPAMAALFKPMEDALMRVIARRFGLKTETMPESVKIADNRVLLTEYDQIVSGHPDWGWGAEVERVDITIDCFSPKQAEFLFMQRFKQLFPEYIEQ